MKMIVEENSFFIVVNKPEGYSVHNEKPNLIDVLNDLKLPTHFVNRLDNVTSGLVVIAKSPELHKPLSEALEKGQKTYRALLRAAWKTTDTNFVWNTPLSDKAEGRKNPQGIAKDRKACLTEGSVVRTNKYFTEALLEIKTGRQHQIRKHACINNCAIVGDPRYNDVAYNLKIVETYKIDRMFLHAESLNFKFKDQVYNFKCEIESMDLGCFFKDSL